MTSVRTPKTSPSPQHGRRVRRLQVGKRTVLSQGLPSPLWHDVYHYAMTASWLAFFAVIGLVFVLLNVMFSLLYMLGIHPIANLSPPGFWGNFFFSIETMATVGYGDMHPQSYYGHTLAAIEVFFGLCSIAMITGIMFARFSRPRARILFANSPVIGPFDGHTTLAIRIANARQNVIVDASAHLRLIRLEVTPENIPIRRLHDLKLRRSEHPMFLLGWTLLHDIDESSPLFNATRDSLAKADAALILTIEGLDETTSQTLHSRHIYPHDTIRWNHRYVDILSAGEADIDLLDYSRFHDTRPI